MLWYSQNLDMGGSEAAAPTGPPVNTLLLLRVGIATHGISLLAAAYIYLFLQKVI